MKGLVPTFNIRPLMWMNGTNLPTYINNIVRKYHDICLDGDSYSFVFTGCRAGGRTTSMNDEVAKAAILYPEMRLLSNYPIEFNTQYLDGTIPI
jgi:hypothetical protein